MKFKKVITTTIVFIYAVSSAIAAHEPTGLSPKQRAITEIASLTAKSDLTALYDVLDSALDSVLTINEAKEVIVHT